jgi:hypothetical protein
MPHPSRKASHNAQLPFLGKLIGVLHGVGIDWQSVSGALLLGATRLALLTNDLLARKPMDLRSGFAAKFEE